MPFDSRWLLVYVLGLLVRPQITIHETVVKCQQQCSIIFIMKSSTVKFNERIRYDCSFLNGRVKTSQL